MIPSRAIKVYKTVAFKEEFVTTVFNGYDAKRILSHIAHSKEAQLSNVTFKSIRNTVLQRVDATIARKSISRYQINT